jgi:hypothetical protein
VEAVQAHPLLEPQLGRPRNAVEAQFARQPDELPLGEEQP